MKNFALILTPQRIAESYVTLYTQVHMDGLAITSNPMDWKYGVTAFHYGATVALTVVMEINKLELAQAGPIQEAITNAISWLEGLSEERVEEDPAPTLSRVRFGEDTEIDLLINWAVVEAIADAGNDLDSLVAAVLSSCGTDERGHAVTSDRPDGQDLNTTDIIAPAASLYITALFNLPVSLALASGYSDAQASAITAAIINHSSGVEMLDTSGIAPVMGPVGIDGNPPGEWINSAN